MYSCYYDFNGINRFTQVQATRAPTWPHRSSTDVLRPPLTSVQIFVSRFKYL